MQLTFDGVDFVDYETIAGVHVWDREHVEGEEDLTQHDVSE